MKPIKLNRIKAVGKNTIADFIRSETGSVGVKNAAIIAGFAGALALSQSISNATTLIEIDSSGNVTVTIAV